MTKKIKFIFVCVILVSFIIVIIPKETKLSNAVINIDNGDIAYCYLDSESSIATLNICVFDKYGKKNSLKEYIAMVEAMRICFLRIMIYIFA